MHTYRDMQIDQEHRKAQTKKKRKKTGTEDQGKENSRSNMC